MPQFRPLSHTFKEIFIFTLVVLVYSCNHKKDTTSKQISTHTDSVQILLTAAKAKAISQEVKTSLLAKAYLKTKTLGSDSLKSKYFAKISFLYSRSNDSSRFRRINSEAMRASKKIKDSSALAYLHWDMADFYRYNAQKKDSAFYQLGRAEKIFNAIGNDTLSGDVLRRMAWIQNLIGDYIGSDITVTKAIKKLKPLNRFEDLRKCYFLMGDNAKLLNDFDKSLEYYNDALMYLRKNKPDPVKEASIKNSFGLVYQEKGDQQMAISYFQDALSFDSLPQVNPRLYTRLLSNLGYSYLKTNNQDQLPLLFTKAIKIQDSISDLGGRAASNRRLAEYYLHAEDTSSTVLHLSIAKTQSKQVNDNRSLVKILRLYTLAEPKKAPFHAKAAFNFSDSLQIHERQIRNKFARIEYETDEVVAENQLLEQQKQLYAGIAAALLLLSISAFIIIRQRIKNQKLRFEEQQQASNQEIFNLLLAQNEKVEEGKKSEQKRVSEELHDGVLGRMLGARMMLLGLNKKTDPHAMAERGKAISMLQDVEGEVRSISHELSHAAYQKIHNFILSIKDLLQNVENSSKIKIEFIFADDLDYDALTGEIKINLYRIIQECVQNAVKHAASDHIKISFDADLETLKIVIADDGKGFVVKKGKKGIGTRNITSRVKKVNGTWQLDSMIGEGTKVSLQIPIVSYDNSNNIRIAQEDLQEF